jgi:hypothetical protein
METNQPELSLIPTISICAIATGASMALVAYNISEAGLDTGGNPPRVWIEEASGNYFDALSLQPYLGHFFHAADEHGANSAP